MSISVKTERNEHQSLISQNVGLAVCKSPIHGWGIFTQGNIAFGQVIYESRDYITVSDAVYGSIQRTASMHLLERYLRWGNHSCMPNYDLVFDGSTVKMRATKMIRSGSELLCNFKETEESIPVPYI